MKINELKEQTPINKLVADVMFVGNSRKLPNGADVVTIQIKDLTGTANLDCFRENFLIAKELSLGDTIILKNGWCKKWCDLEKFKGWDISTGKEGIIEKF